MAATAEWDIPFTLTSPSGTLQLNATTGDRYLLVPQQCDMGADVRAETDNVPQGDGSILHHRFETGYHCRLAIQLWVDGAPACDEDLVRMMDTLNLHVRGLLNAGDNEGRLSWEPSGYPTTGARMLDDIRLAERLTATLSPEGIVVCTFAVDSAYPYAMDLTQTMTSIANGGSDTLTNEGTTDFYPVVKIFGTADRILFGTTTLGAVLIWDQTYPGTPTLAGGDYIEFDFFRNTAYLNGDEGNRMSGIDFELTEFFPLEPGGNLVTLAVPVGAGGGTHAEVLWQSAYD